MLRAFSLHTKSRFRDFYASLRHPWSGTLRLSQQPLNTLEDAVTHATWHPNPDKAGIMVFTGNINKPYTDGIFDALEGIITCDSVILTPHLNIDYMGWQDTHTATINPGTTVVFGPGPNSGTWSWVGPDGFKADDREVVITNISASQVGTYIATNTNACQEKNTLEFEIIISDNCSPTTLTPHTRVDAGGWQDTHTATEGVGGTVWLGPGPDSGTWGWEGPHGYTASTREIALSNIQTSEAGTYIATNINTCGATSTITFTVTVF